MQSRLFGLPWSLCCCIFFLTQSRGESLLPDPHNHTGAPIPGHAICENTCLGTAAGRDNDDNSTVWVSDGICDDGGPGAFSAACDWGTDCDDCDPRDGGSILPPSTLTTYAAPVAVICPAPLLAALGPANTQGACEVEVEACILEGDAAATAYAVWRELSTGDDS